MSVVDFCEAFDSFLRILIVGDETNLRLDLRMTLETEGHEIFESGSGAQAFRSLAERSFALAIVDLRVPDLFHEEIFGSCSTSVDLGCD
jgi:DNA-binding NtrC family response regulator